MFHLAQVQLEQGSPQCVEGLKEALNLYERIADRPATAIAAHFLGNAYKDLGSIRDLAEAERWYQGSLDRRPIEDNMGRAQCHGSLGSTAYERFVEAREAGRAAAECLRHLINAEAGLRKALKLLPGDDVGDLAVTHNELGNVYTDGGQLDRALDHYRQSVRYEEGLGNRFGAGETRLNATLALLRAGHLADAKEWARAALRDFEACENADQEVVRTTQLLELIESRLQAQSQPPGEPPPQPH